MKYVVCLALSLCPEFADADERDAFLAPARDANFIDQAIEKERPRFVPPQGATGITVPHHLLAADLIARGFWAVAKGNYRRIILIGPDHFGAVEGRFATSDQDVLTVYGPMEVEETSVAKLLAEDTLFERADVFNDHALYALSPFVEWFFPDAQVVPVLAAIDTEEQDWIAAAEVLAHLIDDQTLVVQSTDFSHYLSHGEAALHDKETLIALMTGGIPVLRALRQPDHLDSRAAAAIQYILQNQLGAEPTVLANRNSTQYGTSSSETTSYIVAAWHRDPEATTSLTYVDHEVVFFGGDVLLGRFLTPHLLRPDVRKAITSRILETTHGAPLVANLEGVVLDLPVTGAPEGAHLMEKELAGEVLRKLNVKALSLANNHSYDFGEEGYTATIDALRSMGISPLQHGLVEDLGPLRVLPLNLLPGGREGPLADSNFDPMLVCHVTADSPLVVIPHWGREYESEAGQRELSIASALSQCGVSLIAGGHSHSASTQMHSVALTTPMLFSLGNLLFDQTGNQVSSALLEVRVFRQGTLAARLVPLPNLFELAANLPIRLPIRPKIGQEIEHSDWP